MSRSATTAFAMLMTSVALVAAGCGGDGESTSASEPDQWATGFCTAVSSWTDELREIEATVTDPSSLGVDSVKDAIADVGSATDSFIEDVRALGTPNTESGEDVKSSLETLTDTLETEKGDIEQEIDGIVDLTDIPSAVTAIGTSLSAMGTAFQTAMDAIGDADVGGELETALEDSDACSEVSG